jgi:hypothetical protein
MHNTGESRDCVVHPLLKTCTYTFTHIHTCTHACTHPCPHPPTYPHTCILHTFYIQTHTHSTYKHTQVNRDPRFSNLVVLVSDASEPAEGEHKVWKTRATCYAHIRGNSHIHKHIRTYHLQAFTRTRAHSVQSHVCACACVCICVCVCVCVHHTPFYLSCSSRHHLH